MTTFQSFTFKTGDSTSRTRTLPVRLGEIFNVKDFGAIGNNTADDTAAINATFAAAQVGGGSTIFFPAGVYKVTSRITFPYNATGPNTGTGRCLRMLGVGADVIEGKGSILKANFADYLLASSHRFATFMSIEGMGFDNLGGVAATSTEPPPPTLQTPEPDTIVTGGNASGCLFSASGPIAQSIIGCDFRVNKGICLYLYSQNSKVIGCRFIGGFNNPANTIDSFGAIIMNGSVMSSVFNNLSWGIIITADGPGYGTIADVDFSQCGFNTMFGQMPLSWYDNNKFDTGSIQPGNFIAPDGGSTYTAANIQMKRVKMRSPGMAGVMIGNCARGVFTAIEIINDGAIGQPQYALGRSGNGSQLNNFLNIVISGSAGFSRAAIAENFGMTYGVFENVHLTGSGPAYEPHSGSNTWENGTPNLFRMCNGIDPAVPKGNLSTTAGQLPSRGARTVISNSADPLWSGSASNAGKPIVLTGSNRVPAIYDGTNWCICGEDGRI